MDVVDVAVKIKDLEPGDTIIVVSSKTIPNVFRIATIEKHTWADPATAIVTFDNGETQYYYLTDEVYASRNGRIL